MDVILTNYSEMVCKSIFVTYNDCNFIMHRHFAKQPNEDNSGALSSFAITDYAR